MKILTVVSTIFCPFIIGNVAVVSILFSNGKSNSCFSTFLALHCKQSIQFFNFPLQMENPTFGSTIFSLLLQAIHSLFQFFVSKVSLVSIPLSHGKTNRCCNNFQPCIVSNVSLVSIPLSHGKSNRSFNNVSASSCRQSIRRFNSLFSKGKTNRCCNNFLAVHCKQCISCFNSLVTWKF